MARDRGGSDDRSMVTGCDDTSPESRLTATAFQHRFRAFCRIGKVFRARWQFGVNNSAPPAVEAHET